MIGAFVASVVPQLCVWVTVKAKQKDGTHEARTQADVYNTHVLKKWTFEIALPPSFVVRICSWFVAAVVELHLMRVLLVPCASASFVVGGFLRPVGWMDSAFMWSNYSCYVLCGAIFTLQ